MSKEERDTWQLWLTIVGAFAVFGAGLALGGGMGTLALAGAVALGVWWLAMFAAWLFRVTYLAGKRRGDS